MCHENGEDEDDGDRAQSGFEVLKVPQGHVGEEYLDNGHSLLVSILEALRCCNGRWYSRN